MSNSTFQLGQIEILKELLDERQRQDAKHGFRDWPDGTGRMGHKDLCELAKYECECAFNAGHGTWAHILSEEQAEVFAEQDPLLIRGELVQLAAVCVAWIEAIDIRLGRRLNASIEVRHE